MFPTQFSGGVAYGSYALWELYNASISYSFTILDRVALLYGIMGWNKAKASNMDTLIAIGTSVLICIVQ